MLLCHHYFGHCLLEMGAGGMMGDSAYAMQGYNDYDMYEEPDKMTYTEQANKRSNCRRLTRSVFLGLSLFYIIITYALFA